MYSSSLSSGWWVGFFIGALVAGIIFGCITKHINESKGYTGGFAWGFWLGIIGVIVVACKSDNRSEVQYNTRGGYEMSALAKEAEERRIISQGGWKCPCGKVNYHYVSTCSCGRNKREVIYKKDEPQNTDTQTIEAKQPANDNNPIVLIKQLAELHSQGILTDQEFESKKAELLAKM